MTVDPDIQAVRKALVAGPELAPAYAPDFGRSLAALDRLAARLEAAEDYAGYGEIMEGLTARAEAAEAERDEARRQRDFYQGAMIAAENERAPAEARVARLEEALSWALDVLEIALKRIDTVDGPLSDEHIRLRAAGIAKARVALASDTGAEGDGGEGGEGA